MGTHTTSTSLSRGWGGRWMMAMWSSVCEEEPLSRTLGGCVCTCADVLVCVRAAQFHRASRGGKGGLAGVGGLVSWSEGKREGAELGLGCCEPIRQLWPPVQPPVLSSPSRVWVLWSPREAGSRRVRPVCSASPGDCSGLAGAGAPSTAPSSCWQFRPSPGNSHSPLWGLFVSFGHATWYLRS